MRAAAVAGLTVLALTLSACGGAGGADPSPSPSSPSSPATPSQTPSPTPTAEPTKLADLAGIEVSSDLTAQPSVTAPYPFAVEQTVSRVIVPGTGAAVPHETAMVRAQYVGINARTGEVFDSSWSRGEPAVLPLAQMIPGFRDGLVGQKVGSRVAVAIPSVDGYGAQGNSQIGVEAGDSLLFIVDVLDTELAGPQGEPVTPPAGLPQVTESGGVPKITIPAGLPEPTAVQVQPLIQGSGRELGPTDGLISHSVCVTWGGTEFYNDFGATAAADAAAGATHQALFNSLVGQHTGSRILVTLPGSVAYPNGNPTPSIAPNTAVACVVDLLFTEAY